MDSTSGAIRAIKARPGGRGLAITGSDDKTVRESPTVALFFEPGSRPDAHAVAALAEREGSFAVTIDNAAQNPGDSTEPVWIELLRNGLSFDLVGLAGGPDCDVAEGRHRIGLEPSIDNGLESLKLSPGPHLTGGGSMVPVLRSLAQLAANLSSLPGIAAIGWMPADNHCDPSFFADHVKRWVDGGVFPGLALVSLAVNPDGGMTSTGLAQFSGQELRIEPAQGDDTADLAKLALRLIDLLVRQGRLSSEEVLTAPDGRPLRLQPSDNARYIRVWRG